MPKEMTSEERELFAELKKLSKLANQRILRLERETGAKGTFAVKELYDYLSSTPISAISELGRVKASSKTTLMQKQAIVKALKEFLNKSESRVKGVKEYTEKYSKIAGKKLTYKMADTYYKATHDLSWLYDSSLTESVFWRDFAPLVRSTPKQSWVELVSEYKSAMVDRTIKKNLEMLYDYLKGD